MRTPTLLLAALGLGLGAHATRPELASACSALGPSLRALDSPANGVVLIESTCPFGGCFAGGLPTDLAVIEVESGERVAGEILRAEGSLEDHVLIAWRPEQPLTVGRSYEVTWRPDRVAVEDTIDLAFEALPLVTWTADDLRILPKLELFIGAVDTVTCESPVLNMCSGGPTQATVWLTQRTYAYLDTSVDLATALDIHNRYAVRAAFWSSGQTRPALEEVDWLSGLSAGHAFTETADEYCYQLELTSLGDGSVAEHEGCLPRGSTALLPTHDVPDDELAAALTVCRAAPEGLEQPWCSGRRAYCAMHGGADCATLDATCAEIEASDAGRPVPMNPNQGNDAGVAGDPEQPAAASCSARPAAADGRGVSVLFALAGAVVVLRARRWR